LIPNEVWPYQWLPLLPVGLILLVRAVERRRTVTLVLMGLCLLGFWRQPCELFFPNLWTIAGIGIFVLALWENRLFRWEPVGGVRMPLNAEVSFTWVGHGTWKVKSAKGKEILIDPWVMNNPAAPETLKTVDKCDLMLITHGHFDHIHDALEIARRTKPTIVTNHEIGVWLGSKQGIDGERIVAGNQGGTIAVEGIKVTLVQAVHSCGITEEGGIVYGGDAQGLVIEVEH